MRFLFQTKKYLTPLTLIVCLFSLATLGCGGMGENDVRKYAFKRPSDDDDDKKKEGKKVARKVAPRSTTSKPAAKVETPNVNKESLVKDTTPKATSEPEPKQDEVGSAQQEPASPSEIAAYTKENLSRIAEAITLYRKDNRGVFPELEISNLSWRVEMLPYLGYDEIYESFDPDQPWNSPDNLKAAEQIPDEYRIPGSGNNITNVMIARSEKGIYRLDRKSPLRSKDIEDPLDETVLLCLTKPSAGVVWSQPVDYTIEQVDPFRGLSSKGSGYVIAMASGRVGALSRNTSPSIFRAILTAASGDDSMKVVNRMKDLKSLSYSFQEFDPSTIVNNVNSNTQVEESGQGAIKDILVSTEDSFNYRRASESAIGEQCWSAAQAASQVSKMIDGWQWVRGAIASGVNPTLWSNNFKWVPGIKRPSFGLHIAVAANGTLKRGAQLDRPQIIQRTDLIKLLGEELDPIVMELESHANDIMPDVMISPTAQLMSEPGPRRDRDATSLTMIGGVTSASQAEELAADLSADVLVYFDVSYVSSGQSKEVQINIIDLLRGRRIHKVDGEVTASTMLPSDEIEDNLKKLKWGLGDFLEDELSPTNWPVKVDERIGLKRIQSLSTKRYSDPLIPLTEMRYYYGLGVIDQADLLEATERLLGKSDAMALLLGSERKRIRAIREWLPSDNPAAYAEEIRLQAERRQADDQDEG